MSHGREFEPELQLANKTQKKKWHTMRLRSYEGEEKKDPDLRRCEAEEEQEAKEVKAKKKDLLCSQLQRREEVKVGELPLLGFKRKK
ncbi:hypothetical protein K1719_046712 [Acacia pycnantha]|nr:hypothetical protein K1719_046712 [Acacia pycnantha]